MSLQIGRFSRDLQVLLESFSLFVHQQYCLTAQLPEPDAAARANGRDRFDRFIEQIGRQMASGAKTLANANEEATLAGMDWKGVETGKVAKERVDLGGPEPHKKTKNKDSKHE